MFYLPAYRITPSAHPVRCPPQSPSPPPPHPPPSSPSITPSSFPWVRSLCSVSLSDISHTFLLPSLIFPFTIIYIPQVNENIQYLSFSDSLTSLSIIPSSSIHVEGNGGYLSFLMAEQAHLSSVFIFWVSHDMNVIVLISGWVPKSSFVVHNLLCF